MVDQEFDYRVARYNCVEDIDLTEVEQADVVQVRGYVPGGIYHSQYMSWRGKISGIQKPETFIRSKKERKAIRKNKQFFEDQGYYFAVKPGSETLYRQFETIYKETTLNRDRAIIFDLEKVLRKIKIGEEVYFAGMFKDDQLVSSLTFYVKKNKASVAYGAKERVNTVRGGVGGVLELELLSFCLEHDIENILHGRSINPAGITGSAGIFEFKTRYGFTAFPSQPWVTTFINNPAIALSDLVFVSIVDNHLGYIVVTDNSLKKTVKKYQAKEVSTVTIVSTKEVQDMYQQFVASI